MKKDKNKVQIDLGLESDLDEIYQIEREDVDAWSYKLLKEDLVDNQFSTYFVARLEGELVGFISTMDIGGEVHINNISVKKAYRNLGIGGRLLKHSLSYYKKEDLIGYTLEVREDNLPAIHLYEKEGFRSVGQRKNYYKNNKDAIIMWKMIGDSE